MDTNCLFQKIKTSFLWNFYYRPIGSLALRLWVKPQIESINVTLDELSNSSKSICRFGNGEFDIIWGRSEGFQTPNKLLGKRLCEILHSNSPDLMIAIKDFYRNYDNYRENEKKFAKVWRLTNFAKIIRLLGNGGHYYNADLSRPYSSRTDVKMEEYIDRFIKIWERKDLYVVEGCKCRVGVGNSLFDNAKQVKRIEAPAENAIDKYDEILSAVKELVPSGSILFIALGATATVLAYDLSKLGYKAMDLGHLDIEYEYYLRNANGKMKIPGKYTNEVEGGADVDDSIVDEEYENSIIRRIL